MSRTTKNARKAQTDRLSLLCQQGRFAAALQEVGPLVKKNPGSFFLWFVLGVANDGLGHTDAAERAFRKVLQINPKHPEAMVNLGVALFKRQEYEEAAEWGRKSVRLRPDMAAAHYNLGNALRELGRADEAATSYRNAIRLRPNFAKAYNNLGICLGSLGRLDEAVDAYEKALKIEPGLTSARAQKLHLQAQMCDWSAREEFEQIKETFGIDDGPIPPFMVLAFEDNPERQRKRSERYARDVLKT